jgi:hypothetical protein
VQGRCGGPSRPSWTGGRSGQGLSRRERPLYWEHGLLWRARWRELEGRGGCLGVSGVGVSLFVQEWWPFIGGRGEGARCAGVKGSPWCRPGERQGSKEGCLWHVLGARASCWRNVRHRSVLVQRGTRRGAAVVFHLASAMSGERGGKGQMSNGRGDG